MSWADRRKHVIEAILIACGVAFVAVVVIAVTYRTPSCMDGIQNEGEQGVDCGGPCPNACDFSESAPLVQYVRTVSPQPGRIDLIAYIDNSNPNAELVKAPYTIEVYNSSNAVIAQKSGTLTIPPSTTYPLYIPNFYDGKQIPKQAFLNFNTKSYTWLRTATKPVVPTPGNIQHTDGTNPKVIATLQNPTAQTLENLTVVAVVFNAANNIIAVSQTLVPSIAPQGSAPVVFTWNEAFPGIVARIELLPVPTS